ncbi:helix-turn-helix domain-containing protein [Paenibacillus rhizoplanae]
MLEAQRLLAQTESSVTEISLSIGFDNVSSFNKVFLNKERDSHPGCLEKK